MSCVSRRRAGVRSVADAAPAEARSLCCRWNVVGIQGSLLSIFVEPIYLSSIILGSLYHGDHLSRAMYQRISNIEDLPPLYTLNKPLLSGKYPIVTSPLPDKLVHSVHVMWVKAPPGSALWSSFSSGDSLATEGKGGCYRSPGARLSLTDENLAICKGSAAQMWHVCLPYVWIQALSPRRD